MNKSKGQILVEILVAMGIAAIILPALFTGFITSREGKVQSEARFKATNLIREAAEALRVIRQSSWNNIATNGTYHPVISGNTWILSNGNELIDNELTRSIVISDITPPDPSIKKVTITVSWNSLFASSSSETYYMSRYLDNMIHVETTESDFNAGTLNGTNVTNNSGGEVQLGAGGHADWCNPTPNNIVAFNLDKSGVANAISAIEGQVFAGTGDNASGPAFDNVGISNTNPPVPSLLGNFGSNPVKTNGIYGETNYAYLATDTNRNQGIIIDLTNPSGQYSQIGNLDIGVSSANGVSIFVSGNYAYLASNNGKVYIFDISTRTGSHSPIANVDLGATANKIIVVGSNLYAAMNATSDQLKIVPLTNGGAAFGTAVSVGVTGQFGRDVFVNSTETRAYLATSTSSSQAEFFVINLTTRTVIGSYDTAGMDPKGVTVVPGNRAIIVGTGGSQQYQAIDLTTETVPVHCTNGGRNGGLTIATGVNGISSVLESDGDAYSYIITGDASAELKVIEGGPGGKYSNNGTFESATFDAGHISSYNRYITTADLPSGTTVKYQFAVNSGPCSSATFSFLGPDGTDASYYTDPNGPLRFSGECFRYKAFLHTTDPNLTPIFDDITINYSP